MILNSVSKHIISSIVIVGLILSFTGCKTTSKPVQESRDVQNSNYINQKYGFSLDIPKDFAEDVTVKEEGNIVYFVYKDVQSLVPDFMAGKVGRIEIYDKNKYSKTALNQFSEMYNFRYIGENKSFYFGWAHATDVQIPSNASNEVKEKFRKLEGEFEEVIKTFKISN